MVERPIKKSERQPQANTDDKNSENSDSVLPIESEPTSSKPTLNRSFGKGKKASFGDENKQQVNQQGNPALARGPKPVKPKINVKTETETESESISQESQD